MGCGSSSAAAEGSNAPGAVCCADCLSYPLALVASVPLAGFRLQPLSRLVIASVCWACGQAPSKAPASIEDCFAASYRLMTREEDKLGEGQFATVRKAQDKRTGHIVAVKCIEISRLSKEDEAALKVEVEVMRKVRPCVLAGAAGPALSRAHPCLATVEPS